ncbi:MAG: serine/threonine protein kinase, partial [Deltaproteobacteria bacterium]|nr:serine/threonine protein kinase [Deltaproteobacteria bacterium]
MQQRGETMAINPEDADTVQVPGADESGPAPVKKTQLYAGVVAYPPAIDTGELTQQHKFPGKDLPSGIHETGALGRFNILDILGAGGMGIVLAAYDPHLDRKVAIKILRTRGMSQGRREREAARLLREARALAQLSHPHVVTVYDAGTIDDHVFIAMEYIAGQTLRSWLLAAPRSVDEILEVYVKAGRGLAAGHAVGVIHRDFKPDNVLVGHDGRVRVIDFGLAQPPRRDDADVSAAGAAARAPSTPNDETAGALFGTPTYMAPEQHDRAEIDGRTDQFAFCVALYEALYKRLPFDGATYYELVANVTSGELRPPPEDAGVPKRVASVLGRGLARDPARRFPSMDALL